MGIIAYFLAKCNTKVVPSVKVFKLAAQGVFHLQVTVFSCTQRRERVNPTTIIVKFQISGEMLVICFTSF
jgi:hypothetical protein